MAAEDPSPSADPFKVYQHVEDVFDPTKEQHTGIVMGIALASFRGHDGEDRFLVLPGDDVKLTKVARVEVTVSTEAKT